MDRTPLEEQDQNRKLGPRVSWKGTVCSQMHHCLVVGQAWESIYMIEDTGKVCHPHKSF